MCKKSAICGAMQWHSLLSFSFKILDCVILKKDAFYMYCAFSCNFTPHHSLLYLLECVSTCTCMCMCLHAYMCSPKTIALVYSQQAKR